jgi:hypothetical protein
VRQPERRDVSMKAARIHCSCHDGTSTAREGVGNEAKTVPSAQMLEIQACTTLRQRCVAIRVKDADGMRPPELRALTAGHEQTQGGER